MSQVGYFFFLFFSNKRHVEDKHIFGKERFKSWIWLIEMLMLIEGLVVLMIVLLLISLSSSLRRHSIKDVLFEY